jgi:hypothetical protein
MPKYFFDIIDGVRHEDIRGIEFPNDWSAKNHAHTYAQAMVKRSLHGPILSEWEVVVRDAEHEVTRVKFSEADQ